MQQFKHLAVLVVILCLLAVWGCDPGYYDIDGSGHISSVRVFYPASLQKSNRTFHAVTLSGGFSSTKEDMYWLAEYLSRKAEIIVFKVEAENSTGVAGFTDAHLQCVQLMQSEDNDPESMVYQKIDKSGLIGYSLGGGAVLRAAAELGDELDAVVALAPYDPGDDLGDVSASALILVGADDQVAPPYYAETAYMNLPDTIKKCMMQLESFPHLLWVHNTNASADTPKLLISDWIDLVMNGNSWKASTFTDPPKEVVLNWNSF
jgi:hypothetical protein